MRCKGKEVISYFTAVVVFVILLLVSYNLSLLSRPQYHKSAQISTRKRFEDGRIRPHHPETSKFKPLDLIPDFRSLPKQRFFKSFPQKHYREPPQTEHLNNESVNKCSNASCLTGDDLQRYSECGDHVREMNATPINGECTFLTKKDRHPVALVSFPGSGNTWIRGLLEEITGICTGAVYCDISLRSSGFTGEYIRSGSVLAVKTHKSRPLWVGSKHSPHLRENEGRYGSAIFIVRNPFKALVAEWNRKVANDFHSRTVHLDTHVKRIGKEWFGGNPQWNTFVYNQSQRWLTMIVNWVVKNTNYPSLLVKYELLKNDTVTEIQRVLKFLDIPCLLEELQEQMNGGGFNTFHRSHSETTYDHYTSEQRQWVNSAILNASSLTENLDFKEYLT